MAQSLKGVGTPVNFGFVATASDSGVTATGLSGFLLQKSTIKNGADVESIRSLQGDTISQNYYDLNYDAQLSFVIAAASKSAAITATSLASFTPGSIISITACASSPDLINTAWIIQPGGEIPQEITKSAEFVLNLKRFPNITAAQS